MRLSTQIKPISYVKANAAQIVDELDDGGEPILITKNGEAKAVMLSVHEFERTQEALALLRMVAMARDDARAGRTVPMDEAFALLRDGIRRHAG